MANNLNIAEYTMAEVASAAAACNILGNNTGNRRFWDSPLVIRITDHVHNDVGEEDDPLKMALFISQTHTAPWDKSIGALEREIAYEGNINLAATTVFIGEVIEEQDPLLYLPYTANEDSPLFSQDYQNGDRASSAFISLVNPDYLLTEDFEGTLAPEITTVFTANVVDPDNASNNVSKARYYPDGVQGGVGSVEGLWSELDIEIPIEAVQVVLTWKERIPATYASTDLTNCKSLLFASGSYSVVTSNMSINCECWPEAGGGSPYLNIGQDGTNFGHVQNPDSYLLWDNGQDSWQTVTAYIEVAADSGSLGRVVMMRDSQVILDTDNLAWAPLGWVTSTYGYTTVQELIRYSTRGNFIDRMRIHGWFNTTVDDVFGVDEMAFLIDDITVQANTTFDTVIGLP